MKDQSSINLKRVVFEPFKIVGRVIYPVVDILTINEGFNVLNVSPVALVVEENDNSYILNLSYEEISEDEIFELFSSYKQNKV